MTSDNLVANKRRSPYLDVVKGLLIIMVVFAHSIQWGSGQKFYDQGLYFLDPLFKWIYGFHMSLFMAVSGYLFWNSVTRHSTIDVLRSKIRSLLLPIITCQTLYLAIQLALGEIEFSKWLVLTYSGALWFLFSVLISSTIVLTIHRWGRDAWWLFVMVEFILLLMPQSMLSSLHVYMYPYFVAGYLFNKYNCLAVYQRLSSIQRWSIFVISFVTFFILYLYYDTPSHSVYLNGTSLLCRESASRQFAIDMLRYTYGFAGSVMTLVALERIQGCWIYKYSQSMLIRLGCNTMGIYIINCFTTRYLLLLPVESSFHYLLTCVETLVMLAIASVTLWCIRKNKCVKFLFLGEK